MAEWKKVVLSGSAAELSSLSLTTALAATEGGTGFDSYTTGDILYASSTTALQKLNIGSNDQVLKSNGTIPVWGADAQGSVTSVSSTTTSQLTTSGTSTVTLTTVLDGLDGSGGGSTPTAALATGAQIATYVNSRGFTTNSGTITGVTGVGSVSGLTLTGTGTSGAVTLTLGGAISGLTTAAFASGQDTITIGTTGIQLGTSTTTLAGLTDLDFASGDRSFANSIGAGNTLTIASSTSTVRIPGNLEVAGTSSFTDAETLNVSDKVIVLSSGSVSANAGGFIVMQNNNLQTGQAFGYDNATSGGRWGFKAGQADNATLVIDKYVATVQVAASAPGNTAPSYGGTSGQGQIAIDTNGEDMYIYI